MNKLRLFSILACALCLSLMGASLLDPPDTIDSRRDDQTSLDGNAAISLASIQNNTMHAWNQAEEGFLDHLDNRASGHDGGWGIWLTPHYEHTHTDGLGENGLTLRRNSGGASFGLDFDFDNLLVGGAIDTSYGKTTSRKDGVTLSKSENEFYSLMGYADWQHGSLRLYGGLGLAYGYTDLKYDQGLRVKQDIDTYSLSTSAYCEYTFKSVVDISPYIGMRYIFLDSDNYRLGGIHYDGKEQHIVRFPMGVKACKEFKGNGFFIKPGLNFYVEPVCGDTKVKTTLHSRSQGINQTDEARMTDGFYWHASAGVSAGFEAIIFTLSYGYHGSGHEQQHGVTLSYTMLF